MRTSVILAFLLLCAPAAGAEEPLSSPYRQQAETGLRGLSENEIADLQAGKGMGLARAAELNSYPGPRHVLDAVAAGKLAATAEQVERVQRVFDAMKAAAQRVGARIVAEEQGLEAAFRARTITEAELRSRVDRIAALQGQLRTLHLGAHLATRAILSESQIARYDELRGYTVGQPDSAQHQH